tara:strand:+ start:972 stop:1388 length:417 start_codon:yes stop_codon:yes gene_type:complete
MTYSTDFKSSGDYKKKSLTIGYEKEIHKNINIGCSYDILPMEDSFSIDGAAFSDIYVKYRVPFKKLKTLWLSIGYGYPFKDIRNYNGGISYKMGYDINKQFSIYYMINYLSQKKSQNEWNIGSKGTISRLAISIKILD